MKRTMITLAILIAATISIFGQSKDEQAVRQYLSEADAMMVKDEAAAMQRFTADDLIFVGITGGKNTKAERLESIKNSAGSIVAWKRDIDSVRVTGDSAVVVSRINFTSKNKQTGATFNGAFRTTAALAKRDGKWTTVSAQSTRIETEPDEKELNKFMDDYAAALIKNSPDEAAKFLAPRYMRVGPDGSMTNKDEFLAAQRAGDLKYQSIEVADRRWRTISFGSVSILVGRLQLKAANKGKDVSGAYRLTTIVRRDGVDRWLVVSTHISPLAAGN